jgi:hypothetical protein
MNRLKSNGARLVGRLWARIVALVGRESGEEGQSLLWFLICLPLILILIVLVADGGHMYLEYIRARNAANLSAQAGAQAVNTNVFRDSNDVVLNIDGSLYTMRQYMAMNSVGRQGETETIYYGHTAYARVCTWTHVETTFGKIFGFGTMRVGACSTAYPAHGIRYEGE